MVTENDRPDRPSPTRPNFIYNKSGIPLSNESWLKMWKFYQKDYEQLKSEMTTYASIFDTLILVTLYNFIQN